MDSISLIMGVCSISPLLAKDYSLSIVRQELTYMYVSCSCPASRPVCSLYSYCSLLPKQNSSHDGGYTCSLGGACRHIKAFSTSPLPISKINLCTESRFVWLTCLMFARERTAYSVVIWALKKKSGSKFEFDHHARITIDPIVNLYLSIPIEGKVCRVHMHASILILWQLYMYWHAIKLSLFAVYRCRGLSRYMYIRINT